MPHRQWSSPGGIVFLLRTLDTKPQLGVHVKTLKIDYLDDSDIDNLLERLHLMPNIARLWLPYTVERRDYLLSLPEPDGSRPRPRPTDLVLSMVDETDEIEESMYKCWELGPPSLDFALDLSQLDALAIEGFRWPDVFTEEIGPLLPSSLSRLELTDLTIEGPVDELVPSIAESCPSLRSLVLGFDPSAPEGDPPLPGMLETILGSLPTLRFLGLEDACLEDVVGNARHPLLEMLSLQANGFLQYSDEVPADHLLNTAVDDLCRLCQDPHAFPSLRLVRLGRSDGPDLKFNAGSKDYRQPGVVEMARKLKDVGLDLEDDYGYPWRNEWFSELEGGL
jgi:hypothetical protein